jgi:hypothetical protein
MAYFAELDENSLVLRVVSISSSVMLDGSGNEQESLGVAFCHQLFGANTRWVQTSYNTRCGEHVNGGTPLRKNYAGIGFFYDSQRDAFIGPKPDADGWTLNEQTCCWNHPDTMHETTYVEIGVTRV